MGICLSNSGTLCAIDKLGLNHDAEVLEWRDNLLPFVSTSQVIDLRYYMNDTIIIGNTGIYCCNESKSILMTENDLSFNFRIMEALTR